MTRTQRDEALRLLRHLDRRQAGPRPPLRGGPRGARRGRIPPEVVRSYGLGHLPGAINDAFPGRREVKQLTGRYWVPALVLDDGTAIQGSQTIIDWAQAHPAAAVAPAARSPSLARAVHRRGPRLRPAAPGELLEPIRRAGRAGSDRIGGGQRRTASPARGAPAPVAPRAPASGARAAPRAAGRRRRPSRPGPRSRPCPRRAGTVSTVAPEAIARTIVPWPAWQMTSAALRHRLRVGDPLDQPRVGRNASPGRPSAGGSRWPAPAPARARGPPAPRAAAGARDPGRSTGRPAPAARHRAAAAPARTAAPR